MRKFLHTKRCILRQLSREDAPRVWEAAHTPGFTDGMLWEPPETMEDIYLYTQQMIDEWKKGVRYVWTIEDRKHHDFIGRIEVDKHDQIPGNEWGLGYWIHPEKQQQGYATEAAKEVLRFTFENLRADAVTASHRDWNTPSGKVLHNIGMKHTGRRSKQPLEKGIPIESEEYRIDREQCA